MNNEDFYLNVDVILKHTGCSTSSRSLSRSNSGCSSSSGASTSNSCVSESLNLVRVVDHDADKAKPLIIDEWRDVFDNIGREFVGGVKAVWIAVDQYKMCTGYKILILRNDKTRFTAKCEEDGCGWRIHFGHVNGDISRFVLKYSNVIHSCGVGLRLKSHVVTTKLVKHLIADSIQGDPTLKPKQIMSLFKKTYGSNIKYHHAPRGKEAVFEDQYGDDEKSYSDLNCLKVMQMNSKRRVEGLENFNTRLTPVYEDLLNENINIGRTWTVVESMEILYEVRSPRTHSVDLLERTCTCHRWKVNGFPCAHACDAIQSTREDSTHLLSHTSPLNCTT
ncbi:hypothetical protein C5167_045494 [Papaver somniferum]|uniref:SWIM-type domain-containing protein n=1 Tax=Papaver somniferum TaxID=3469 RepID=A0A4Y7LB23_PAPSO|nr:hypothetical protein C5167_045494 [Papaver somniferum]